MKKSFYFFMLVAVLPLFSFSENQINHLEILMNRDFDAEALEAYNEILPVFGQQEATETYQAVHAQCTQAGGDSEFETEIDG
ncbi:hypothetical protein [Zunongwangia endophytica]|uniref:Uncharacterized protein n=1 Tax=Zunongwangia endophytica TaxID=1808945 RepID=A0ABV8HAH7_9FLAO|nr:hypothetical protein [Zunongwangia endophytica]MDN3594687.1 hypothetical protein [Zunongwangia endophytica]